MNKNEQRVINAMQKGAILRGKKLIKTLYMTTPTGIAPAKTIVESYVSDKTLRRLKELGIIEFYAEFSEHGIYKDNYYKLNDSYPITREII